MRRSKSSLQMTLKTLPQDLESSNLNILPGLNVFTCSISNFSRHQPTSLNPDNLLLSGLLGVSSAVVDNVPLVQATPSLEVKLGLYWDNGKSNANYYNGDYIGVYYIRDILG